MDQESVALPPTVVCFGPSPSYGIHGAREAHDWFLGMMREHEEFVPHFVACVLRVLPTVPTPVS